MTTTTLDLSGIRAASVRLVTPWIGAWFAEVDLDLEDENAAAPTGRKVLTIGTEALTGTIDPRASSKVGARASVRLVAGAGAWDAPVAALHVHNDAGVTLATVAGVTAAEVGEVVGAAPKASLGVDYVRRSGPASRVLHGHDWYVDDLGITRVEARAELAAPAGLEVLGWDPATATATIAPDVIARPGWTLTDDRFGSQIVRDVEQTWTAEGTRATAFCAPSSRSRLGATLAHAIRELAGVAHLGAYPYRVVAMAADRVVLQAIDPALGMPDAIPLSIAYGAPGVTSILTPGDSVLVEFTAGDPARPRVRAFLDGTPIQLGIDATAMIEIGKLAAMTRIGLATEPVALALQTINAITAVHTECVAIAKALVAVTGTPASPVAPLTPAHATAAQAASAATDAANAALSPVLALLPAKKVMAG